MRWNDLIDFQGTLAPIILLIFQREKLQIELVLYHFVSIGAVQREEGYISNWKFYVGRKIVLILGRYMHIVLYISFDYFYFYVLFTNETKRSFVDRWTNISCCASTVTKLYKFYKWFIVARLERCPIKNDAVYLQ